MTESLATVAYLGAAILFILSLGGLSHPETARRGNLLGMLGMGLAVLVTVFGPRVSQSGVVAIVIALVLGGGIGLYAAKRVKMTQMPELVALMHSLVGLAACLVGFASYVDTSHPLQGAEKAIHAAEIYIGILIGAVTFSGSLVAFGKLNGRIGGKPLLLPGRHLLNLLGLVVVVALGCWFVQTASLGLGMLALLVMTAIALLFGVHMVMAIGGADMPVVVSMLNSYSGWAAAGIGFSLNNPMLIIAGSLVGSSGAILSYIMCKAMNRSFFNVILGGFGGEATRGKRPEYGGRQGNSINARLKIHDQISIARCWRGVEQEKVLGWIPSSLLTPQASPFQTLTAESPKLQALLSHRKIIHRLRTCSTWAYVPRSRQIPENYRARFQRFR